MQSKRPALQVSVELVRLRMAQGTSGRQQDGSGAGRCHRLLTDEGASLLDNLGECRHGQRARITGRPEEADGAMDAR